MDGLRYQDKIAVGLTGTAIFHYSLHAGIIMIAGRRAGIGALGSRITELTLFFDAISTLGLIQIFSLASIGLPGVCMSAIGTILVGIRKTDLEFRPGWNETAVSRSHVFRRDL